MNECQEVVFLRERQLCCYGARLAKFCGCHSAGPHDIENMSASCSRHVFVISANRPLLLGPISTLVLGLATIVMPEMDFF